MPDSAVPLPAGAEMVQPEPEMKLPPGATLVGKEDSIHPSSWVDSAKNTVSEWWKQVNPVAQAGAIAGAVRNPLDAARAYGASNEALWDKAKESFHKGDYTEGAAHALNYVLNGIPGLGAVLDEAGDKFRKGDWSGGMGETLGLATNLVAGAKAPEIANAISNIHVSPSAAARRLFAPKESVTSTFTPGEDIQWAKEHEIPVSVGTETGSKAIGNIEAGLQNAPGGAGVAREATEATRQALSREGAKIANSIAPGDVTPESAGSGIQEAIGERNAAIESGAKATQEALAQKGKEIAAQVHPAPATPESSGANVQQELEATRAAQAAAAREAYSRVGEIQADPQHITKVQTGTEVSPELDKLSETLAGGKKFSELSPEDKQKVTAEAPRFGVDPNPKPVTEDIPLATDMRDAKASLWPVYEELKQQMPVAQQQASRGLKAIENIVNGPDHLPAMTAEANLGAVKAIQREAVNARVKYLAGQAIDAAQPAVDKAVSAARADALDALKQGRALTKAKYATQATIDNLPTEPVQLFSRLVAGDDKSISALRDVKAKAPASVPAVGRAVVEGLIEDAQTKGAKAASAAWDKIGDSTKQELFGDKLKAIDDYFKLARNIEESGGTPGMEAPISGVRAEPVQAYHQLLQAKDTAINALREVSQAAPGKIPGVSKAYVENLIESATSPEGKPGPDTALSSWNKLGPETKKILFTPQQISDLDNFFKFASRAFKNRNPSGTAYVSGGQYLLQHPVTGLYTIPLNRIAAKILFSPGGAKAMTNALKTPISAGRHAALAASAVLKNAGEDAKSTSFAAQNQDLSASQEDVQAYAKATGKDEAAALKEFKDAGYKVK